MKGKIKEEFLLWGNTGEHKEVVEDARNLVDEALTRCEKPYVAYSGGKDSTALVHLVTSQKPDCMVLHWDYGSFFMPREVLQEILSIARDVGALNLRVETSEEYERLGRKARNVLGREFLGKLVPRLSDEGYDCCFIGLRGGEGVKRRERCKTGREQWSCGMTNFFPLRKWSWMDSWAYIVSHDLPYLSVYDRLAPLVGWDEARFVTFFDGEFECYGSPYLDGFLHPEYKYSGQKGDS